MAGDENVRIDLLRQLDAWHHLDWSACTIAELGAVVSDMQTQLQSKRHAMQGAFGSLRRERRLNGQRRACWRYVVYTQARGESRNEREEGAHTTRHAARAQMRQAIAKRWAEVAAEGRRTDPLYSGGAGGHDVHADR